MIRLFDIADVNQSASTFNPEKLLWLNQQYIIAEPAERLGKDLVSYLKLAGIDPSNGPDPIRVAEGFRERAETLLQMAVNCRYCYEDFDEIEPKSAKKHLRPVILVPLRAARDRFSELSDWAKTSIARIIEDVTSEYGIKMAKLGQPIRVATTGGPVSPPIDVTLELIGRERTVARLDHAIEMIEAKAAAGPD